MEIPDFAPELPESGGPQGGQRAVGVPGAPDGWADAYVGAAEALDLGATEDEILGGLAQLLASYVANQPGLWWRVEGIDLSGLGDEQAQQAVYAALSGCDSLQEWDAAEGVRLRHLAALAFSRGWVQRLGYAPSSALIASPTRDGLSAVNAYQRRMGRPELPR